MNLFCLFGRNLRLSIYDPALYFEYSNLEMLDNRKPLHTLPMKLNTLFEFRIVVNNADIESTASLNGNCGCAMWLERMIM
jgi:hypothetical protein